MTSTGDHLDLRPLLRFGAWGMCAVVALSAAVFSAQSGIGEKRVAVAVAALRNGGFELPGRSPSATMLLARAAEAESETRRLNEAVRILSRDRDRLSTRLAAIERNLEDLTTGSIAKSEEATAWPPAASPTDPFGQIGPPNSFAPSPFATSRLPQIGPGGVTPPAMTEPPSLPQSTEPSGAAPMGIPADVPLPRPNPLGVINSYVNAAPVAAPPPEDGRRALGIDLGAAETPDGLRTLWLLLRSNQPALLKDLQPVMALRLNARTGKDELRLLGGPVGTPDAAAKICAVIVKDGFACRPAVYEGEKLALDAASEHNPSATAEVTPRPASSPSQPSGSRPSPASPGPQGPLPSRATSNAQNLRPVPSRNQLATDDRTAIDRLRNLFSVPDR